MRPGLLLQRLTTRQPTLDQLEVAIVSLRAVMTAEQIAEVDARVGRPAPRHCPAFRRRGLTLALRSASRRRSRSGVPPVASSTSSSSRSASPNSSQLRTASTR